MAWWKAKSSLIARSPLEIARLKNSLRLPDGLDLNAGCALAGNGGRLGFNGHAQLQDIENAIQGSETVGVDHVGLPAGIAIDERPGTLPA